MSMCGSCSLSTYLKQTLWGPDGVGFSHGVGRVGVGVGLLGGDGCGAVAG